MVLNLGQALETFLMLNTWRLINSQGGVQKMCIFSILVNYVESSGLITFDMNYILCGSICKSTL